MEYSMKYSSLQIAEVVKCQAGKDKFQEKENSQDSVSERKSDRQSPLWRREDNASEKKIYPLYKMTWSKLSFSRQVMEVVIGSLLLKHNTAIGY